MRRARVLLLATLGLGCGGDDWHDLSPLRTDCGQNGGPCCDGIACYNGGRCVGATGSRTCRDPEQRQRNECRSENDCGPTSQCGGAQSCLEDRVCFLCQAPFAGASHGLGQPCDGNMSCTTGLCFGNICAAPCRIGAGGDAACRQAGASFYCAAVEAYYQGTTGPLTTVSVCLQRCADDGSCADGLACVQVDDALQNRVVPTCRRPRT